MSEKSCIVCKRTSEEIPVTEWYYKDNTFFICPQHTPTLIHNPQDLVNHLPGAEGFEPG